MTSGETLNKIKTTIPNLKTTEEWDNLNYKKIPVTVLQAKEGNEVYWNKIISLINDCEELTSIKRTPSGGICTANYHRWKFHKYDVIQNGAVVELTYCDVEGSFRLQWRAHNYKKGKSVNKETKLITASSYLAKYFIPACNKFGVELGKYEITNGEEVNKQIHKPDVAIYNPRASWQFEINGAHHLDFHKFYISGLVESHPEFKPVVEYLLNCPEEDKDLHKTGLASIVGYFHSKWCKYKYASLAKDAINTAYKKFDEVKAKLNDRILATRTDAIWYIGDVYHDEYEGEGLGKWSNDYVNCKIRFKSVGSYEFICNGKYYPIVSGLTRLDKILEREDWQWGDIFTEEAKILYWNLNKKDYTITWKKEEEK